MKFPKDVQCYCCEKAATTKDHIPPKCFFPEKKYLSNSNPDYRSQLITVPSCSERNNFRSKDDEYTAAVIAMNSKSDLAFLSLSPSGFKLCLDVKEFWVKESSLQPEVQELFLEKMMYLFHIRLWLLHMKQSALSV